MPNGDPMDLVSYLGRPIGERITAGWPDEDQEQSEDEVREELDRRGVHLGHGDRFDIETTEEK